MSEKGQDDRMTKAMAEPQSPEPVRRAGGRPVPPDQTGEHPTVRTDSETGEMWIQL